MTEEERRQRLIAMGLDPEQYTYQTAEEKAYEETTALGAVGTGVMSAIGGTIGGVVGTAAPLALMSGPPGWAALGLGALGGLAGAYIGGQGQEAAEGAMFDDAEQQALALQRQVAYEKHPWLTFAGQAAPSMAFFRPSPTVLKNVFGAVKNAPLGTQTALQRYALGNVAIGGGLEAGVDLGVQAMGDEDIDWGRVAGAGALGGLLTEPTRAFGKVGATLSRSGLDSQAWLESKGMTRPLTEIEAANYALAKGEEHTKAVKKNREETDKAILEYSVNKDARKLVKKPDFHSLDELREAGTQAKRDVDDTKKAASVAAKAYADIQKQSDSVLKSNPIANEARQLRTKIQKLQKASEDASVKHREALDEQTALNKQIADLTAKTAKAIDNAYDRDKRNRNRTDVPEGPKPTDSDYFKSVQGLMAKQGMYMNEAVADLKGRENKGTFDIKGEYDIQAHAVTLNKISNKDTPWHEYLHGIVQVLKRSPNPKHQRLIDHIETGMFKDDSTYKKMIADGKSLSERTAWTEEHIVQRGGKILEKRMSNPPEGFIGGLKKWFSDWRLERDAATGFQPKYTDKKSIDADNLLDRMAEWMAMRGERQPALQPKQIDAMLADLAAKSPYDNFDSVLGRSRYARDVGGEVTSEDQPNDSIAKLKSKADAGKKITVSHIGAEDLSGFTQDALRKTEMESDLADKMGWGLFGNSDKVNHKAINLTKNQNFLEGAGHGADVVVLHRIPNERTAQVGEQYTGPVSKGHTLKNWQNAVVKSDADLVYIIAAPDAGDFTGLDFFQLSGYKAVGDVVGKTDSGFIQTVLQKDVSADSGTRYQRVNAEELVGALKVVAMHDSSVQYSKRVRAKMMERIKAGTYTVEQGQKALARFASKPFPAEMSGEEIAQVVNGMEMYHGSAEADAIMREGFKGEELSPSSIFGRGVYMTPNLSRASFYAQTGDNIAIRTNFKNLLNFDLDDFRVVRVATEPTSFNARYEKAADDLGYSVKSDSFDLIDPSESDFIDTPKVQNDFDSGLTPADIRNRILFSMGYDGLTAVNNGYREVVAFREPFDKATDQLQEYYGSKRLQRMNADEYLGDVKDYQLTSYTDHYASNPAAKRPWFLDSVVDRIRMTGETSEERRASAIVSDAFAATARDAQTLDGQFIQNFELVEQTLMKLSPADAEQVQIYMAHARRTDPVTGELTNPIPAETLARYNEPNSVVKHYVEWFRKQYTEARRLDIEAGVKIYHPKTGELTDPGSYPEYSPEVINQTKWRELSGNDATKRDAAKKELADWWKTHRVQDKTHKNYISDENIKEAVDAYVARLAGNDMAHLGSTKFGALRKAEGIGLPLTKGEDGRFNWIEPSAANTFTSYFRRWSKDHSFFKNVEQNPDARAILGLKNPTTGEHVPTYTTGKNPFHVETTTLADGREINKAQTTDKNIKDFIKSYLGYYDGEELFGRTANRLVVSHWLGLMSGVRDLGSSYVFTLPHLRGQDMGLIISSLKDFSKSWIQSHLYGVNKTHANRIEFATETHNKLADFANKWADTVSKYSGRTPLERITRAAQFGLGRAVVMKHMGVVKGTDITVDRNMRRLGSMSGIDINLLRRHADKADPFLLEADNPLYKKMLEDLKNRGLKPDIPVIDVALDRMAASWVEANQGTYDARGVPAWTMSGSMSMYTSLARWNIEKFNTMKQEVVRPMMDEGDYRPLIKSTLGAVFTGTLLIELAEYINNKFRSNPTLEEAIREGDEEEIAYAVADSISYAGYFGVASALGNDMVNFARGQRPQGAGVVFPAWDFISQSLTEPIFDAVTAIEEGEDPVPTVFKALHETIRNTHQTYRIIWNNDMLGLLPLGREQVNDQNIRRDLRIFRRFEGIRGVAPVGGLGNRMLRPKTREFKEADTIEEAQAALPEAFEEQRRRAKGRGDKLKSYAQGLYAIPDKTLPSPSTREGAEEFMRYREYLTRQRGEAYWRDIFNEWVRNREGMTPAKKFLVKKHIQQLIQQSPST